MGLGPPPHRVSNGDMLIQKLDHLLRPLKEPYPYDLLVVTAALENVLLRHTRHSQTLLGTSSVIRSLPEQSVRTKTPGDS
jgi:hypothetical protein